MDLAGGIGATATDCPLIALRRLGGAGGSAEPLGGKAVRVASLRHESSNEPPGSHGGWPVTYEPVGLM